MSDFSCIKEIKKTRKPHHCFLCCRDFPAGSAMYRWNGVFEGDFFHSVICPTCEALLHKLDNDCGYAEGDMDEYCRQYGAETPEALLEKLRASEVAERGKE